MIREPNVACTDDLDEDAGDFDDDVGGPDGDFGPMWLAGLKAADHLGLNLAEFAELALVPSIMSAEDSRFWYCDRDLDEVANLALSIKLKRRHGLIDAELAELNLPPVPSAGARQPSEILGTPWFRQTPPVKQE